MRIPNGQIDKQASKQGIIHTLRYGGRVESKRGETVRKLKEKQ